MQRSSAATRSDQTTTATAKGPRFEVGGFLAVLALLAAGLIALALLSAEVPGNRPIPLQPTIAEGRDGQISPTFIVSELEQRGINSLENRDQTKPLWLSIPVPENAASHARVVEIQVLRFESARLWLVERTQDSVSIVPLDRASPSSTRETSKGGFAVLIQPDRQIVSILAEVRSYMPGASPSVYLWDFDSYVASELTFERRGGVIFGGLLILAIFSAIVALLNRDITFLLFCGWIVTSLRISAVNAGWDAHWLGISIENETYLTLLRGSIAAYGLFTVALFRQLLLTNNTKSWVQKYLLALQHAFLLFIIAAPFASHISYLRVFWAFAAIGLGTLTVQLVVTLATNRTRIVSWYALSWSVTIFGMANEIGIQSGIVNLPAWLNSQSASIVSALVMGLALADRMKSEREARIKAQARSVKVLKQFEENYNSMPVGLFSVDDSGRIALHNPAFSEMFGIRPSPTGTTDGSPAAIDDLLGQGAMDRLRAAATQGDEAELEFHLPDAHDQERWFLARVSAREGSIEGSIQEITVRKAAERKLQHLVDHDYLTGLLNRRGLEATLQTAIRTVADGGACAIAYVDLDRFKLINDLHGHSTGDTLLQQSAKRLQTAVRSRDAVARIADAFIVVFFDCPEHAVDGLTERVRQAIREAPFQIEDKGLNMTASVGVVPLERTMTTVDALAAADRACGEAKARGRDCVVRLTDQDDTLRAHLEELKVVADLQQRIPTDRYFLEFQPIVALQAAMSSLSYEVLIRMRGEQGQTIPPGKFIGAAERNGLMSQIDRWVLRSILEWLDTHPDHRDRLTFATLNISGASLNDTRFVDDAFAMIAEHPLSMPKLCFEITESVALHDVGSTRRFVDRVRMYGSKVALDDFGAGYTSFNYLKEIPADFIKIDGSFVKDINRNPANFAITRTIVDLTHELGMRSIAEWAETPDTIASLIGLGVDYGQGFGLVRPIAPARLVLARSGGELVGDPQVVALLAERARMHAGAPEPGARRRVPGHEAPPR